MYIPRMWTPHAELPVTDEIQPFSFTVNLFIEFVIMYLWVTRLSFFGRTRVYNSPASATRNHPCVATLVKLSRGFELYVQV